MAFTSVNPATEEEIARYAAHTPDAVEQALDRAVAAHAVQRERSFAARARRMRRVADLLEERADTYGRLMTREMGKPLDQATGEVEKCAWVCRYYAEHAADFLSDEPVATDATESFVAYEPLGPLLAIMPWNFPFWQLFRFGAPALMAGNSIVLKHAPNVMGCAEAIEAVVRDAGFDAHELQHLRVDTDTTADIIADDRVRGVTLTGSVGAGRAVAQQAGQHLKPTVLELGGSDPFIVCADADLDRALDVAVQARMQNNGQSCIAAKRFIVEEPVADTFRDRFVAAVEDLSVGDPTDAVDLGPMARADLRDQLHDQVERAIGDGALALTGGHPLHRTGFYYAPTVLAEVEPGTVAFDEELFGPVAAFTTARDLDHAVALANATDFGLGGAVFTEDLSKGQSVARRLACGCAFVNAMTKSDPRVPFGGIKNSGYGRELSHHGIHEFVNAKTIWVTA
ncbi:NAD-dependent succinate-semialdehyde dehydrogenase [Salisaeta longa]|uniref:NAD-dependent succinate-semialdehyde dehydrogenase n=1 Tax=Salisaeta longa TaxID=503170 RepID=UPI0003B5809A|nr:NAD-dependent succinate-semialdehyde dehydrogenase [Salisaeta longa]